MSKQRKNIEEEYRGCCHEFPVKVVYLDNKREKSIVAIRNIREGEVVIIEEPHSAISLIQEIPVCEYWYDSLRGLTTLIATVWGPWNHHTKPWNDTFPLSKIHCQERQHTTSKFHPLNATSARTFIAAKNASKSLGTCIINSCALEMIQIIQ